MVIATILTHGINAPKCGLHLGVPVTLAPKFVGLRRYRTIDLMQRGLIRTLLKLSDLCAWMLLCLALLGAFLLAFAAPLERAEAHQALDLPALLSQIASLLLLTKGAHLLTRRKPIGLLLVQVISLELCVSGAAMTAAIWLGTTLLVLGTPLAMVWWEIRSTR